MLWVCVCVKMSICGWAPLYVSEVTVFPADTDTHTHSIWVKIFIAVESSMILYTHIPLYTALITFCLLPIRIETIQLCFMSPVYKLRFVIHIKQILNNPLVNRENIRNFSLRLALTILCVDFKVSFIHKILFQYVN